MLDVSLPPETEDRLEALAARSGRTKSDIVREAIVRLLKTWKTSKRLPSAWKDPVVAGRWKKRSVNSTWTIEFEGEVIKQLGRLDRPVRARIIVESIRLRPEYPR